MVTAIVTLLIRSTHAEECVGDTFLPFIPGEDDWNSDFRAVIYL